MAFESKISQFFFVKGISFDLKVLHYLILDTTESVINIDIFRLELHQPLLGGARFKVPSNFPFYFF